MKIRPRRSVLFVPGSNPRALEKAKSLPADGMILDLEDAVAPDAKAMARRQVVETLHGGGFGNHEIFIRVNGIDTPWFPDDMDAAVRAAPDAILIPKITTPEQLEVIAQCFRERQADGRIHIWAMIETPLAILNISLLAAQARNSDIRLAGFVVGTNDLARETRSRIVPGRAPMLAWLSSCVLAARSFGVAILDGVYNSLGASEGFARECREARDLGFDGKTLIHPSQIEACNAAFSPTPEEVAEARKIVAAFALPENQSKGVLQIEGRMVERLHAEMAERILAVAEAINSQ